MKNKNDEPVTPQDMMIKFENTDNKNNIQKAMDKFQKIMLLNS